LANTFHTFLQFSQNKHMEEVKIEKNILPYNTQKFALPQKKKMKKMSLLMAVAGLFIGFVNGLFGAGGGMLAVPVLTVVAGLNMKRSHATAILVILPLCAVSSVVYLSKGIDGGDVFLPTILGVVLGGIFGAYALKKCSNIFLQILFYGVMLLAGIKMVV
jgi:uncharacterized membrane protein YfcA